MTQIYSTGTVSVTNGSAAVVGTGTAWAVALVTGGVLNIEAPGNPMPIASVTDDTHLTGAVKWTGTTGTYSYAIVRESSDAASVVDLQTTVSRLLVTLSLAGIHPDASGNLTDRAALSLTMGDKGYLFLHAEIGVAFAFYRWNGTSWEGPFAVANAVAAGGVSSLVAGAGVTVNNTNPAIPVVTATRPGTAKTTPVDADEVSLFDSAASYVIKKLTWANLKATLKSNLSLREVLTANRTYYVRKDGSDSNNGLADTAGGAFLTIQNAINVASALDLSIYTVTITVRVGTYTENVTLKTYVGGTGNGITIIGDTTTPSNILLNGSGICFNAPSVLGVYTLQGMKLASVAANSGHGIQASNGSIVNYGQMDFGALTGTGSHIVCFGGAIVNCVGNYTISGSAFRHWWNESGGFVQAAGRTITLTGTPAFSNTFAYANMAAIIQCNADTFTGSATGQRYQVAANSVISSAGGVTYLPGSSAGSVTTGGVYS
ncbi:hypothetical protein OOJ09_18915 [Mesorhizobium qingshengii]|uniref:Uncharacterized protein n=1 Tax=Mesorhizobium qingshengii TaxID=1165689 RepID=A0ABT4QXQ8_9HYPH|nr:hypothetical protein [Mesorhizobium qingshengii]MCZ8546265.1 hypothetical protein [Mesorhizobium qingshengii]